MKKLFATIMTAIFVVSMFAFINAKPAYSASKTTGDVDWICGTPELKLKPHAPHNTYGNPWYLTVTDNYWIEDYLQKFDLIVTGVHCDIWVGLNDTYGDYYDGVDDSYHFFMGGWAREDVIYGSWLTYMANEFDNVIYPSDTTNFGVPKDRPAGDPLGAKINIMIFNIRDDFFWFGPPTVTSYIAGYFSASTDLMEDRNIIHIDIYDWVNRIKPVRPLYEGVIAHEFEHLIHFDMDFGEFDWVDEGCADMAGFLCGYGHSIATSHMAYYLRHHWWIPLTVWLGTLGDYGASYLFMLYLYEHYGGARIISAIVHEQANGIEGINNALKAAGYKKNFDAIFQDWTIANYLDDTTFAGGIYGYSTLNIPSTDTGGRSIEQQLQLYWGIPPYESYPVVGPEVFYDFGFPGIIYGQFQPYTAHYIRFANPVTGEPLIKVHLDGDEIMGLPAYAGTYEYYSNFGNWLWNRMYQKFTIPAGGATLKFMTYYEIEGDWDYGFVEVHDLTTDTWTTLPGVKTVDYVAIHQDSPNVPSGFEPMDYEAAGKWNGLTGFSGGWYQEVMDLTPFAGHQIELHFTYWTDAAYNEKGWFIDNIEIPQIGFSDNVEAGTNGWTILAGWQRTTGLVKNSFKSNIIQKITCPCGEYTAIWPMLINKKTQEGCTPIIMLQTECTKFGTAVMVVANQPGFDTLFATTYAYDATTPPFCHVSRGTMNSWIESGIIP